MILPSALSRPLALSAIVTMVLSGLVTGALVAPAASAAPGPITARPTTAVTADALPTVQVNGVVWSQAWWATGCTPAAISRAHGRPGPRRE